MTLPAIMRPNGKIYQPRLIRTELIDDEDHWPFVVVLGTHDIEFAGPYAQKMIDYTESGLVTRPIGPVWYRHTIRDYETCWTWDDVHGSAGILFATDEKS